ncbi:hypothetical protein RRV45_01115 [Bacillus sp. DTU_2020_1000418_1_SI_GHA_SEK_038]|uniref:hypothetical protein n=1 Tax=Bacillus sp. DTU_2020_1000418_1_SI_GHA_SEK_038 TaxID=3077585 RepID=UPI0028E542A8|nr:hypothetical protein [Bacillus sp. DTU_2020_1000418_1_SI_GHA_SEK_038]WNS75679.1 hypothetical protein RRV45_01115 [Bacillus sp. DTU_2020_1000418_1_SI_GHA_SEK_038]
MKEINSNIRFVVTFFIWAIIFCIIYSVLFYPINYFILKFSPKDYFGLFAGVFICSGVLFHRFYLNLFDKVVQYFQIKNETFWNGIALIAFNFTGLFAGFLVYLITKDLTYAEVTAMVYSCGAISWFIPLNIIRREVKERQIREERSNKIFIDENGIKRLYFKL